MHGLSFTSKSWAKFLAFLSAIYAWPATWSDPVNLRPYWICTACEQPAVIGRSTNQCQACFKFSHHRSGSLTLHSDSSPLLLHDIDLREVFEFAHLKFPVSGRSKQTIVQAYIHTHIHNAVMLVWGLLRLAPIKQTFSMIYYVICIALIIII